MRYKTTPANLFNPEIPFGGIFELFCEVGWDICEPTLWLIWCDTVQYSIPIALQTKMAYYILTDPYKDHYYFWTLLEWFSPLSWWRAELKKIIDSEENRGSSQASINSLVSIFIIHRPYFKNPAGMLWSRNEAYLWGTFEHYPLNESYKNQLARHLCEVNNYQYKPLDPNLPSSSQRPVESYPMDRIIPEQDNPHHFREFKSVTEYYVPKDQFQQSEDLAGNDNEELMDELMAHKHMFPYREVLSEMVTEKLI